ncbi:SCAN domain-containing protein 3-like [Pelobates fuscus]|uniref:SCAN domain-containing protein 3-like n=1 Tax=Pelobates fuscus TaxID=191477 RepID=UPI002FE4908F
MDKDPLSEKILHITLKIICLLTGEDCVVVKKSDNRVRDSSPCPLSDTSCSTENPVLVPPLSVLVKDRSTQKKIVSLANLIIQLLTEEVPAKCEVDVNLSVEDWEYLEGHKEDYEEWIEKKHLSQKSLGSANVKSGEAKNERNSEQILSDHHNPQEKRSHPEMCTAKFSNRNKPKRRHIPCYSQDFTQDNTFQMERGESVFHPQCKDKRGPSQISSGCDDKNTEHMGRKERLSERPVAYHKGPRKKEDQLDQYSDRSSIRILSERCHELHYTKCCMEEDEQIPCDYEMESGEGSLSLPCKEEEIPTEISPDGSTSKMKLDRDHKMFPSQNDVEEDNHRMQDYQGPSSGFEDLYSLRFPPTVSTLAPNSSELVKGEGKTMKELFFEKLTKLQDSKANNSKIYSQQKYYDLIRDVKLAKVKQKKEPVDYRRLARYDILLLDGEEKLIEALKGEGATIRYFLYKEELFDILHDTHLRIGHGGRTRMEKELQGHYTNITKEVIMTYLTLCKQCQQKHSVQRRSLATNPKISSELHSRCQVDVIDMQSNPDSEYKFILNYEDHSTKFILLRPLKTRSAEEVANVVLDIFTTIGAPSILQSDSGREFSKNVLVELTKMCPELKMVNGRCSPRQSEDSAEQVKQDVSKMLATWMKTNNTAHWTPGLKFIQMMKNKTYHPCIQKSPYEAMFGCKPKMGLMSSSLPKDVIENLKTEEDLELAEAQLKYCPKKQDLKTSEVLNYTTNVKAPTKIGERNTSQRDSMFPCCVVCNQTCPETHECTVCRRYVHTSCSIFKIDDHDGLLRPICSLCNNECDVKRKRPGALNTQRKASKMIKSSANVEDYVKIRVIEPEEMQDSYDI